MEANRSENLLDLLKWGRKRLEEAGIDDADIDCRRLYSYISGKRESMLFMYYRDLVSENTREKYKELIEIRASGVPLQHITGSQNFMGLDFKVNEHVLIPRRDTEVVVEEALRLLDSMEEAEPKALDLCCGSGAIGVSIAALSEKGCRVDLADISRKALEVTADNVRENGVEDKCRIVESDLFQAFDEAEPFDMVISNPPYIKSDVIEGLQTEVRDHEPRLALDGGADGLDIYRRLVPEAMRYLKTGGWLIVEIGSDQGESVPDLFERAGFTSVSVGRDLADLDRYVEGRKIV